MILYVEHTDTSKQIIKCNAIEDCGEYLKVFTDYGSRNILKFGHSGILGYTPGIASYQLDGYPHVVVKQNDTKENN